MTAPASGWDNADLAVYLNRKLASSTRTPTRSIPASGATSTSLPITTSSTAPIHHHTKINVGAIVGGVIGGVVLLLAVVLLALCCMRRRRKQSQSPHESHGPAELAPSGPMTQQHEIASPASMHKRDNSYPSTVHTSPATQYTTGQWAQPQQQPAPFTPHQYYPPPPQAQQYYPPPPPPQQSEPERRPSPIMEMPSVRSPPVHATDSPAGGGLFH